MTCECQCVQFIRAVTQNPYQRPQIGLSFPRLLHLVVALLGPCTVTDLGHLFGIDNLSLQNIRHRLGRLFAAGELTRWLDDTSFVYEVAQ